MYKPSKIIIQLSNRKWIEVYYTSPESATIFFFDKKKNTIKGGPLFNVKTIDNEWQLNLVAKPDAAQKIWPKIKEQVAFEALALKLTNLPE